MLRSKPLIAGVAVLLALGARLVAAQQDSMMAHHDSMDHGHHAMGGHPHETAFSQGPRDRTIGAPHLDVNAGLYHVFTDLADVNDAFIRLHAQAAIAIPYLGLASDLVFVPAVGATPTWSAVVQAEPLPTTERAYLSGGVGVITGRSSAGDRLKAWVQATAAYRLPLHGVSPFVQVGRAFGGSGHHTEVLLGIAHPLAPYEFHLP